MERARASSGEQASNTIGETAKRPKRPNQWYPYKNIEKHKNKITYMANSLMPSECKTVGKLGNE